MTVTTEQAQQQLGDLLERVAQGEQITIVRGDQELARLIPPEPAAPSRLPMSAEQMLEFRSRHKLHGVTIRELIEEGRRR